MKARFDAILQPAQAVYLDNLLPKSREVLAEMEQYAQANGVPIADREVALFLEITARAIKAKHCLEIGMAIGYGAAHLAKNLTDNGKVVTIEPSDKMIEKSEEFLTKLGLRQRIEIIKGKALDVLPTLEEQFDLIYLDAIKEEYAEYLSVSLPLLRRGGVVIADNLLWGGQVAGEISGDKDIQSTLAIREFNRFFVKHPQMIAQILPVGDGLGYAVKIS